MSIKRITGGGVVATGEHTSVFRWLSIKGMVTLESHGMQTRGGPIRPRIAAELGLKPRDSYAKFLEAIQAKLSAVKVAADAQEDPDKGRSL